MKTIIIAGGTGLVGTRLTELLLLREYNVITLSRNYHLADNGIFNNLRKTYEGQLTPALWDVESGVINKSVFEQADAIINLAGAGILDQRWDRKRKELLIKSRTMSSELLVKTMNEVPNKIKTVIQASAIGWYGDDKYRRELTPFKEETPHYNDFLGSLCYQWEESIMPAIELEKRLVILRLGIVLSNFGGAFPQFKKSLGMRVASVLGTGKQVVSWIHIFDLCEMILFALENEDMEGVYNAAAPFSVTNERLVKTMGMKMHASKYAQLKVPKTILKMALGEMSEEVLKSSLVSSKKILDAGFEFHFPKIDQAVEHLINQFTPTQ